MKLEKEGYINDYEFNIDGFDYITLVADKCFTTNEKNSIIGNYNKKMKLTLEVEEPILDEVEEPILDEVERKYLSGVIRPFRDKVYYIKKRCVKQTKSEYITIGIKCDSPILLPYFEEYLMYKGMKLDKGYTLEELGL